MTSLKKALAKYLKPGHRPMATRHACDEIVSIIANAREEEKEHIADTLNHLLGPQRAQCFLEPEGPDNHEDD